MQSENGSANSESDSSVELEPSTTLETSDYSSTQMAAGNEDFDEALGLADSTTEEQVLFSDFNEDFIQFPYHFPFLFSLDLFMSLQVALLLLLAD